MYIPGDHWIICDRCGCKVRRSQALKTWEGLLVCKRDWEPKHPQLSVTAKADKQSVVDARPDVGSENFIATNDVTTTNLSDPDAISYTDPYIESTTTLSATSANTKIVELTSNSDISQYDSVGVTLDNNIVQWLYIVEASTKTYTETYYPSVDADDYWWTGSSFYATGREDLPAGNYGGASYNTGIVFKDVNIYPGATHTSTIIEFTAQSNRTDTVCNLNCYFEDVASGSVATTATEADALSLTSAVAWSAAEGMTQTSEYNSPDLKTIFQTITDKSDWVYGNDVHAVIKDNSSDTGALRVFYSIYKSSGIYKPELQTTWTWPTIVLGSVLWDDVSAGNTVYLAGVTDDTFLTTNEATTDDL